MIGHSLTHYRITAKLGAGGMGEVYRATDTKLGREVAIKVLPSSVSRDAQSLARFAREAKALASLNHPHIAAIHGFDADQGTHFLVLELVEGETLADRLRRGALPLKDALAVAKQIAEALQEAHEKGIIHRDLKPGNVKITPNGRVKVLDFGLAKMTVGTTCRSSGDSEDAQQRVPTLIGADAPTLQADTTQPGAVMGTPAYMSPEQARGQEVDKRTDVWAFGCCLYECLSGRKPFQGRTASDLMAEVLKSEPDWSQIPPETPPAVGTLLRRCLEKESSRRLSSLGDIALTLDESTRGSAPSSAPHIPQPQSVLNPPSSRPAIPAKWLWPAATGLLMLLIVAGFFFWKRSGAERHMQDGASVGNTKPSSPSAIASTTDQKSIAVLPFVNMSADKADEYLSDGMTEELLNVLARIPGLRVPGRSSSFAYKGKSEEGIFRKIGEQLHVNAVLEGSVRKAGSQLRITAQLINVADGFHLWSDTYDRDMTNVFSMQSEVAQQVAAALKLRLGVVDAEHLLRKPTANFAAYELYLKGRFYHYQFTDETSKRAIDLFNQAIALDPAFAKAYAGLAAMYAWLSSMYLPPSQAMPRAKSYVLKALELDESLAEAHHSFATIKWWGDWDFAGADREFKRSLELNPNEARVYWDYADFLTQQNRFEDAIQAANKAEQLAPTDSALALTEAYYNMRQFEKVIELAHRALKENANFWEAHYKLASVYAQQGKFDEAITESRRALQVTLEGDRGLALVCFAGVLARAGKKEEARTHLDEINRLSKQTYISPAHLAVLHEALGDRERAFAWLQTAYDERCDHLLSMNVSPGFDSLRTDPRFQALLKKVGL